MGPCPPPNPHIFAHFLGLSPAPSYLEPTLNNSDSLWAPCSRRTWTCPPWEFFTFTCTCRRTPVSGGGGGGGSYSFPLCTFIPSQQHQSKLSGLECRLKSCFDETCVGSQEKNAPGKKRCGRCGSPSILHPVKLSLFICELQLIK